jgi:hypothetical protein
MGHYFRPTMVTDHTGRIAAELTADLVSDVPAQTTRHTGRQVLEIAQV